ncbi:hypothetical protein [Streptococcus suis]|uniref:LPXTG-motif cell wall anchor domain-containing protein n=1 Tax=Streptococcus suis TaxID=1307 RepID=A0A0Z8NUT9_STRSU|nr:hypothetical protein [Streptococcus suis]MCQ8262161.1 hypothetical protein [Streptococcus suis]CYW33953.1 LPXTG-motif cell wall anchor domain-containing protein [Streptococcus suis]
MTKNFTTKAAKVLTIATLSAGTLIGAIALDTTTVSASSVSQISGDEKTGEIELVTNAFPTFEAARDFMNSKAAQILFGESYQGETTPELPGTGYVVSIRIQYDALTSKDQAISLANQVVAAADTAFGGSTPTTPAEPEAPVTPVEPTTPTEPNIPVSASSVSQISGDESKGKIQVVTNSFPTFESAQIFVNGQMSQMLFGKASYRAVVIPENSLYIIEVTINYDALTSKDQAIALANQVVAAADSAISRSNSQPTPTPIPPQDKTSQLKVYRLYHAGLQVHLYTTDTNEATVLQSRGWKYEGISWNSERQQGESVYRLYHPALKVHLYTKDTNEYRVLAGRGWKQEGVAYRSYGTVPVYRMYHTGLKKHLYTKDLNEYTVLAGRGWKQEGIAWYSQP